MPKTSNLFRDLPCSIEGCERLQVAKGACRLHYQQAHRQARATKGCMDCGRLILPEYTRCQSCQRTSDRSRFCRDCGTRISHRAKRGSQRCWPCFNKERQATAVKGCSIEGCERPHTAKGMCRTHYRTVWRKRYPRRGTQWNLRHWVGSQPCQLCGYSRLRSHVHRLIEGRNGGQYVIGNMVALCARCHEEVGRGLTPPPPPLFFPEEAHHAPPVT